MPWLDEGVCCHTETLLAMVLALALAKRSLQSSQSLQFFLGAGDVNDDFKRLKEVSE